MKAWILLFSILSTGTVFAMSDAQLVKTCSNRGIEKMQQDAALKNCDLILETLDVHYIENHFYNPSKFIGYNVEMNCSYGRSSIFMLVQYDSFTKECM